MPTLLLTIAADADDAQEDQDDTDFSAVGVTLSTDSNTSQGSRRIAGLRFDSLNIPPGSTINTAVLSVLCTDTATDDPNMDIFAEDVDDAADFTTTADIVGRTKTTASVQYTATAVGAVRVSPADLSTVVQEVVDRAGWANGNALMLLLQGKSDSNTQFAFEAQPGAGADEATLTIGFTPPDTVPYFTVLNGSGAGQSDGTDNVDLTTGTITVDANKTVLVAALIWSDGSQDPVVPTSITADGGSPLSFTSRGDVVFESAGTARGRVVLYSADSDSVRTAFGGATGTVSLNLADGAGPNRGRAMAVLQCENCDADAFVQAVTDFSDSTTTTFENDTGLAAFGDATNNATLVVLGLRNVLATFVEDAVNGWIEVVTVQLDDTADYSLVIAYRIGGDTTPNPGTYTSSLAVGSIAAEIAAVASGVAGALAGGSGALLTFALAGGNGLAG